jgi:hypothetical protein
MSQKYKLHLGKKLPSTTARNKPLTVEVLTMAQTLLA